MNPPPEFPGGSHHYHHHHSPPPPSPPKREVQLQGPRPAPLKVSKDSHKIRKPPPHPQPRANHPPVPSAAGADILRQQPVIIYAVSPKVVHASVSDFMSVVQRLTGPTPAAASPSAAGALSPAARLASIERTSPSAAAAERERERLGASDLAGLLGEGIEVGQFPGILSPAPATLPPIPAGFFSPVSDPQTLSFLHDLSPFWANNSFMASPSSSALFSAPLVSPSPSSMDIFTLFDF